ncbi:hypothetical protein A3A75_06165 [Candidatus Woesebacteria bacterium RIFCSPLOWO2_01_FULL_39_10]|uniref:Peptidase S51 n=1 Tax=Candidatus Woesebacteria bacterium RIFCSPLOWO2_01_FULL_39_10 TaxID=1802516 RepID=A0A1F8B470_9BACT|nr:MAG: hypothetical protein A3A75_06165 [Candidatus Woesebacteria bacterium RIFCSPLOWO2_01_FULL_39_10]
MKKLFLASETKHPESMDKLEKFVGGFKGKTISYIPTAANGEEVYGSWEKGSATWKLVNTLGAKVKAVPLEDYKNSSVLKELVGKDIIWFAGGMAGYLMYWVRRCEIDKNINELLESGSIYVGSSAGSMVCAKTLHISEIYLGEPEVGSSIIPGFGLIDFDIYPHYDDAFLPEIKKVWNGGDLYLLKNGEAITVVGDKVGVLGEKRILREGELIV